MCARSHRKAPNFREPRQGEVVGRTLRKRTSSTAFTLIGLLGSPHLHSPGPIPMSVPISYAALTNNAFRRSPPFWSVMSP